MNKSVEKSHVIPNHIAIIMDGNGRWAKARGKPRVFGHRKGVETVREVIRCCSEYNVSYLTLFAFSSENWQRPEKEVNLLMELFITTLENEIQRMHNQGVRLRVIGDISKFRPRLQEAIARAEALTKQNNALVLSIAANYGGHWDILNATRKLAEKVNVGEIKPDDIDQQLFAGELSTAGVPDPDLFIRTGGEYRISNFLLWQIAYSELYFTDIYWPDFDASEFIKSLDAFSSRQRRYGLTGEQIKAKAQC